MFLILYFADRNVRLPVHRPVTALAGGFLSKRWLRDVMAWHGCLRVDLRGDGGQIVKSVRCYNMEVA